MAQDTRNPMLRHLDPLVGEWKTESTHPALPGTVVPGRATFEWLEGRHYLVWRESADHPDFPDSLTIFGCDAPPDADPTSDWPGGCLLHSYDSRGIFRVTEWAAEEGKVRLWRLQPGFSMRCAYTLSAGSDTMTLTCELSQDGATWEPDLQATYRRAARG
ncbi:MAG TPA: hypothetical protein VFX49_15645 [Chloroflexota bacterium]|nr:hypothetical protein [Chloroflexota bacterium]